MNEKDVTEHFIHKESVVNTVERECEASCEKIRTRTESDAVHPRFQEPREPEVIERYQRDNDYYCEQCKLYFAPTVLALQTHFKEDMMKHRQIGECFYCSGAVYGYSFRNERQIYHTCETRK